MRCSYVTRTASLDHVDLAQSKAWLVERGNTFAETSLKARAKIAELGEGFSRDGSVVMSHGNSRVVLALLKRAAAQGKHFSVVVRLAWHWAVSLAAIDVLHSPSGDGGQARQHGPAHSQAAGGGGRTGASHARWHPYSMAPPSWGRSTQQVTLVLDSAAAFMMERVDLVLVGAEGVVESGGIINKLGTFQIATVAKAFGKAVYVAAESYKFARLFPLNQGDLPVETKTVDFAQTLPDSVRVENPSRDYTPPHLITLLFTDLGVLTPSAVSDELIQLYL